MTNLFLVYVNPIGKNSNDEYEYEFFFSEDPETVWAEDWNIQSAGSCNNLLPSEETYNKIIKVKTIFELSLAIKNTCFSLQDCKDHIIALFWFEDFNGEVFVTPYGCHYIDLITEYKDLFTFYETPNP